MKFLNYRFYIKVFFLALLSNFVGNMNCFGQDIQQNKWFSSFDLGLQMSGIKSEDFVYSNYSPVYRISLGRGFSTNFAVQVGYQGKYFLAISDDLKYEYSFFFIEGMANLTELIFNSNELRKYNLWFHTGPGYFYHKIYNRSNLHWNLGCSNTFDLSKKIGLKLDVSAIIGWDIYQGNNDILPNISMGILFRNLFE